MINMDNQKGYAVLAMILIILLSVTMLSVFITKAVVGDHHSTQNVMHGQQAFQAAQAGIEHGIVYLSENKDIIANGHVLMGSLDSSGSYSVSLNFIGGTNDTVNLVATGTSLDGLTTRTIEQTVKWVEGSAGGVLAVPLLVKGSVSLAGNAEVTNLEANYTIDTAAATVSFSGNGKTTLTSGTSSDSGTLEADINLSNATLAAMSADEFAQHVFGNTVSGLSGQHIATATVMHTGTGTTNYSSQLDEIAGQTIYINQDGGTVVLNSNTDIGTAQDPVTIVVNGSIDISGNTEIYGNVIVTGSATYSGNTKIHGDSIAGGAMSVSGNTDINGLAFAAGAVNASGNTDINGGLAVGGAYTASGNADIIYDSVNLAGSVSSSAGKYGRIPGSWRDF